MAALHREGKITASIIDDLGELMASTDQWYWCFEHQRPEHEGEQCRASGRLGPYPTEEAARNWKATNEAHEEAWKEQDEVWEGQGASDD